MASNTLDKLDSISFDTLLNQQDPFGCHTSTLDLRDVKWIWCRHNPWCITKKRENDCKFIVWEPAARAKWPKNRIAAIIQLLFPHHPSESGQLKLMNLDHKYCPIIVPSINGWVNKSVIISHLPFVDIDIQFKVKKLLELKFK